MESNIPKNCAKICSQILLRFITIPCIQHIPKKRRLWRHGIIFKDGSKYLAKYVFPRILKLVQTRFPGLDKFIFNLIWMVVSVQHKVSNTMNYLTSTKDQTVLQITGVLYCNFQPQFPYSVEGFCLGFCPEYTPTPRVLEAHRCYQHSLVLDNLRIPKCSCRQATNDALERPPPMLRRQRSVWQ